MANFSVELRTIVEAGVNIFGFPYDFYDESKRAEFEKNFIRHFYFREIGCETTERFRWYLEDKMRTVFPYYNELFKAAQIEYNILDNYNVTEEYEITRKGIDKSNNVSSTVGQSTDNQTTNSTDTQTGESTVKDTGTVGHVSSDTTVTTGSGTSSEDVTSNDVTTTLHTIRPNSKETRKFLDTPQGKLNLESSDYLTDLAETTKSGIDQDDINTTTGGTKNTTGSVENKTNTSSNGNGNETRDLKTMTDSHGSVKKDASFTGEQKVTQDNNTRTEKVGSHVEKSTYHKKGNIGIDTDSDMITKHINLQKVLRNIERMFFDECEDLFMLVYE